MGETVHRPNYSDVESCTVDVVAHQVQDTFESVFKVRLEWEHAEQKLCLAILEDAIGTLESKNRDGMPTEEAVDARRWIKDDTYDWVFNFNPVCDMLGLEPSAARKAIFKRIGQRKGRAKVVSRNSDARPTPYKLPTRTRAA